MDQVLCAIFDFLYFSLHLRLFLLKSLSLLFCIGVSFLIAKAFLHQMVFLLSCLKWCESEIILHLHEIWRGSRAEEFKTLNTTRLGSNMNGRISYIVFLEQLR